MTRLFAPASESFAGRLLKSLKPTNGILPAVLTYPVTDYQGDEVVPDGGDWSKYPLDPVVNWDHDVPVGRGTVTHKAVRLGGTDWTLPVGSTQFFESSACLKGLSLNKYDLKGRTVGKWDEYECLKAAEQARALVQDEVVTGVSLEFEPTNKKSLGYKSLLEKRDAYRIEAWKGLGWAHTDTPVNPGARLARAEKALKALESGKEMPAVIRKSLTRIAHPLVTRPVAVRGVDTPERTQMARTVKALSADELLDDTTPLQTGEEEDGMLDEGGDMDGPTPTVKTLLDGAQMILDLCSQIDAGMSKSEHSKGKKYAMKVCENLKKDAAEMQTMADKIQSELGGGDDSPDEPDGDEVGGEPEVEEDTGDAMTKSLRKSFPRYSPQRLRLSDLRDTPRVMKAAVPPGKVLIDADELARMERLLESMIPQ